MARPESDGQGYASGVCVLVKTSIYCPRFEWLQGVSDLVSGVQVIAFPLGMNRAVGV